jgi:hypothetical protein
LLFRFSLCRYAAGRSLPLFVVVMTLASQSIDSNALLGRG